MRRSVVVLLALVLAACASTPEPPPPIDQQMRAVQLRLFMIVEEKRERLVDNAKPLALDPKLTAAAQAHADAMAHAHAMDGKSGDENPAIHALMQDPNFQGMVSENVGELYYNASLGIDVDAFAQAYLETWLKSDAHKRTLLYHGFDRTGIGIATDGKAIFVSEIFTTDLGLPPRNEPTPNQPPQSSPVPSEVP